MQVWNVLIAARCKYGTQKNSPKIAIWAPSHNFVELYLRNYDTYRQSEKNLLSSNISSRCLHNMVNFGLLAAEIVSLVWGTAANFSGFRVLAALLHGTLASAKLRRWTEGATCIRQGGHWPTFLVVSISNSSCSVTELYHDIFWKPLQYPVYFNALLMSITPTTSIFLHMSFPAYL